MSESSSVRSEKDAGFIGLILRIFWMFLGNAALFALAILINQKELPLFSLYDLLFGAIVVLLILARFIDIAYFHGGDSYGEPATMQHWRRYAIGLFLISLAVWSGTHAITYFF